MKQKVAIITGGSSGLGLATARKFTQQNIRTYIIGRNKEKLQDVAALLGSNCTALAGDVSLLSTLPDLVDQVHHEQGQIDILVNNAGINLKKPLTEVTDEEFQRIILTNLTSVFSLTREVAKRMIVQGAGSIINISSMAAHYGIPKVIAYSASKAGIEGMTRAMAVDLSPSGIRVNCIAPGFIATPMSSAALDNDPERKQKVLSRTPMGKLGKPEDVANAAYFLTTEEAAFMTGVILPVDGGNSIGF
jgi:NAD(P)-dependent dehydrogenase (short-subunit alcohol dehydrogenase family)